MQLIDASLSIDGFYEDFSLEMLKWPTVVKPSQNYKH